MKRTDPVTELKGVGESVAKRLAKLGISTVEDLIFYYPRRYDDYSRVVPIAKASPGNLTICGEVKRIATRYTRRRGFTITEALIEDASGALKAIWFNQPYLAKSIPIGVPIYFSGALEAKNDQYALFNPVYERVSTFTKDTARIVPVYPETKGLTSRQLRGLIQQVQPFINQLANLIPPSVLSRIILDSRINSRAKALEQIHFPDSSRQLESARRYLAAEELFLLILTGLVIKQEIKTETGPRIKFSKVTARSFVKNLTFKLTNAQRSAAWQVLQDVDRDIPMNRLLEGDVGSGKTVVAALAAAMTIANGYQVALLAPTAILARQHFQNLKSLLPQAGIDLVIQGSRLTKIKSQLAVGTHALIQESVSFQNLGLVIVDEQHRFGVDQRNLLKIKAGKLPHLLTMSATPIPRSLALTIYGDLDISVINQMPPGRKTVTTTLVSENGRETVYQQIEKEITQGRQVYVVTPLISESDKLAVKSVEAEAARLKNSIFSHRRLAVLHGRMKPAEKDEVMQRFTSGKIDILVSTTVLEVGVDIPNASVMLVEGAERFGLAALHQLRGRVGRSEYQSYCYLIATKDKQSQYRLGLLEKYNDGFKLAQKDLEIRGPGAIYGTRQHGLLDLRVADLSDTKLIAAVRQAAQEFIAKEQLSKHPDLLAKVNELKTVTRLD